MLFRAALLISGVLFLSTVAGQDRYATFIIPVLKDAEVSCDVQLCDNPDSHALCPEGSAVDPATLVYAFGLPFGFVGACCTAGTTPLPTCVVKSDYNNICNTFNKIGNALSLACPAALGPVAVVLDLFSTGLSLYQGDLVGAVESGLFAAVSAGLSTVLAGTASVCLAGLAITLTTDACTVGAITLVNDAKIPGCKRKRSRTYPSRLLSSRDVTSNACTNLIASIDSTGICDSSSSIASTCAAITADNLAGLEAYGIPSNNIKSLTNTCSNAATYAQYATQLCQLRDAVSQFEQYCGCPSGYAIDSSGYACVAVGGASSTTTTTSSTMTVSIPPSRSSTTTVSSTLSSSSASSITFSTSATSLATSSVMGSTSNSVSTSTSTTSSSSSSSASTGSSLTSVSTTVPSTSAPSSSTSVLSSFFSTSASLTSSTSTSMTIPLQSTTASTTAVSSSVSSTEILSSGITVISTMPTTSAITTAMSSTSVTAVTTASTSASIVSTPSSESSTSAISSSPPSSMASTSSGPITTPSQSTTPVVIPPPASSASTTPIIVPPMSITPPSTSPTSELPASSSAPGPSLSAPVSMSSSAPPSNTTTSSPVPPPPPSSTPVAPPPVDYVQLHPNGDSTKCLDLRYDWRYDGSPVQIYDCNGTPAQNWVLNYGPTAVRLAGSNYCLDAGAHPYSGTRMKIWNCYDNLPAQEWWLTSDRRIALENQGFCLDLTDGVLDNGQTMQIWKCTDFNTNQIWTS